MQCQLQVDMPRPYIFKSIASGVFQSWHYWYGNSNKGVAMTTIGTSTRGGASRSMRCAHALCTGAMSHPLSRQRAPLLLHGHLTAPHCPNYARCAIHCFLFVLLSSCPPIGRLRTATRPAAPTRTATRLMLPAWPRGHRRLRHTSRLHPCHVNPFMFLCLNSTMAS